MDSNGDWLEAQGGNPIVHGNNNDANIITSYGYDDLGRRSIMWDTDANSTQYQYEDYTSRLEATYYPDGTRERYVYNDLGQRLGVCDANLSPTDDCVADNFSTAYSYDDVGRLTGVTNGEGETVSYDYDDVGRVTGITNGRGNDVRSFDYVNGRLTYECDASANGNCHSGNHEVQYTYDANGNLEREDIGTSFNLFEYDELNRLTLETYGADDISTQIEYGYTYNDRGMLYEVYDGDPDPTVTPQANVLTTYTYDALGRPTDVVQDPNSANAQSIHYGYDDVGNRLWMETRIGGNTETFASYGYDALNRVDTVRDHDPAQVPPLPQNLEFWDDLDNDTNAAITGMQYNPLGQMTSISRPNQVTTSYTYGDTDVLVDGSRYQNPYQVYEIDHSHDVDGLISQYAYEYDGANNRSAMNITTPNGIGDMDIEYQFDKANRMISESYNLIGGAQSTTEYAYDRAGNRTQMRHGDDITRYSYNDNDELIRVDMPDYYFEDYTYDARGNLTLVEAGGHGTYSATNYAYNARDQLISFGTGGTPIVTYGYDHRGNRTDMTVAGSTTSYLWDEFSRYGDVILETNPTNTIGYTLAGGMLVAQTNNGNVDYFLQDAQNSTVALADTSGVVEDYHRYTYNAFGELQYGATQNSTNLGTSYLYTGQQFDAIYSELYNLRARQYDPSLGRFLTRDTWAYDLENPVELNRYAYAQNNPATFSDPSGYSSAVSRGSIGALIVGFIAANPVTTSVAVGSGVCITFQGTCMSVASWIGQSISDVFWTVAAALSNAATTAVQNATDAIFGTQAQAGTIAIPGIPESISIPQECTGNGNCQRFVEYLLNTGLLTLSEAVRRTLRFTIWVDGGSIPNPIPEPTNWEVFGGGRVGEMIRDRRYDIFYNGRSIAQPGSVTDAPVGGGSDLFLSPAFHTYIDISGIAFDSNNLIGVPIATFHSNLSHGAELFGVSEIRQGVAWRKCKSYIGATAGNLSDALSTMFGYVLEAQNPFRAPHMVHGNICPTTYSNQAG